MSVESKLDRMQREYQYSQSEGAAAAGRIATVWSLIIGAYVLTGNYPDMLLVHKGLPIMGVLVGVFGLSFERHWLGRFERAVLTGRKLAADDLDSVFHLQDITRFLGYSKLFWLEMVATIGWAGIMINGYYPWHGKLLELLPFLTRH
jgi:hypothetical protein